MFSFRRKSRQKVEAQPAIRASPSLPELNTQGIPWPEALVDRSVLAQANDTPVPATPQGAARSALHFGGEGPIPFHKPWSSPGKARQSAPPERGHISSMYASHPPSAFETRQQPPRARVRVSQRKARAPTTFNVMVVGAQGTGKTSMLRLLLDTADISPTSTPEQRAAMERFLRGPPKRTAAIEAACVEICESRYDRVLLSVIDTPGLDFQEGHELELDRQVTSIVHYIDTQYADTLNEESKVIRQSKGDQHIHLCIYMIDPASILPSSARRTSGRLTKMASQTTVSQQHTPELSTTSDTASDDIDDEEHDALSMAPADIRVIRRLMKRTNVLPVIARADSLTDDTLSAMKLAVRRELRAANLDFGVFGPAVDTLTAKDTSATDGRAASDEEKDEPDERRSRNVIKLRPGRFSKGRPRSQSRSRMSLSEVADEENGTADIADTESVASVRFSAAQVARSDLSGQLPFALIAPEQFRRRRPLKMPKVPDDAQSVVTQERHSVSMYEPSDDGHASVVTGLPTPTSPTSDSRSMPNFPYLNGPPADLKGVFIRKFRWGTVDVLSPQHCDFAAMRTAILSTHLKMLKIRTNEVLYEKYRTEKLLTRRATKDMGETETKKLLEESVPQTDFKETQKLLEGLRLV